MCPTTELMVHVSVSNRLPMECSYVREAKIFMFDGITWWAIVFLIICSLFFLLVADGDRARFRPIFRGN